MQNKLKTNTVLLVIIIILLVVGFGYVFLKDSNVDLEVKDDNNLVNDLQREVQVENDNNDLLSEENINLKIKTGIELFMSSTTYKPRVQSNKSACSSILYGYENNYAYAWVYCGEWDKNLKLVTSSSFPVKAQYDLNYQIISVAEGPEGESMEESKKLFGDFYYITAFPGNEKILSLKESALNKIK